MAAPREWPEQAWPFNEWHGQEWVGESSNDVGGAALAITGGVLIEPTYRERDPHFDPYPPSVRRRVLNRERSTSVTPPGGGGSSDMIPPTATIVAVTPDPREDAVSSITIVFSEAVFGVSLASFSLRRDSGSNLLGSGQSLSTSDNIVWTLSGLAAITAAAGVYAFRMIAGSIVDAAGNAMVQTTSESWTVNVSVGPDTVPPTASIVPVSPDPTTLPISNITIVFDEAVTGFNRIDMTLKRDGGSDLLTSSQTLTTMDSVVYTLSGLSGITATAGNYVLTLVASGSGITDAAGNALAANATESWTVVEAASPVMLPDSTETLAWLGGGINPVLGTGIGYLNSDALRPRWPRVLDCLIYTSNTTNLTDPVTGAPNTDELYQAAIDKYKAETPGSWWGTYISATGLRTTAKALADCAFPAVCVPYTAAYDPSWFNAVPEQGCSFSVNSNSAAGMAKIRQDISAELTRRQAQFGYQWVFFDNTASSKVAPVSWENQMANLAAFRQATGRPCVANCTIHYRLETTAMLDLALASLDGFSYEATLSKNWCSLAEFTAIISNLQYMSDGGFGHYFYPRSSADPYIAGNPDTYSGDGGRNFQRARTIIAATSYTGDDASHGVELTFSQPHYLETGYTYEQVWLDGVNATLNGNYYDCITVAAQPTKLRIPSAPHGSYSLGTAYFPWSDAEFLAGLCLLLRTRATPFRCGVNWDPAYPNQDWFGWVSRGYRTSGYSLTTSSGIVTAVDFDLSGGDHVTLYPIDRRVLFS